MSDHMEGTVIVSTYDKLFRVSSDSGSPMSDVDSRFDIVAVKGEFNFYLWGDT